MVFEYDDFPSLLVIAPFKEEKFAYHATDIQTLPLPAGVYQILYQTADAQLVVSKREILSQGMTGRKEIGAVQTYV